MVDDLIGSFSDDNAFVTPDILVASAWLEHGSFAMWLAARLQPKVFVELGTHNGFSYFCFAQSITRNNLGTKMYAIDTWRGDEHAGYYDDDIFENVNEINQANYISNSTLLRETFDDGLKYFDEKSIDLLHIDGLHTYEAVKNDFLSWLPKMSNKGIVLFHDISIRDRGFGVYKLWEELAGAYPSFEFSHGNGLGVLKVGHESTFVDHLFTIEEHVKSQVRRLYSNLGKKILFQFEREVVYGEWVKMRNDLALASELSKNASQQLENLHQSISWKITAPLRAGHKFVSSLVKKLAR